MTPDLSTARWRKSTRSTTGGNCVEVADATTVIAVRDTKDPAGPVLTVTPEAWTAFTTALNHEALA
jgi:hypothetical protein